MQLDYVVFFENFCGFRKTPEVEWLKFDAPLPKIQSDQTTQPHKPHDHILLTRTVYTVVCGGYGARGARGGCESLANLDGVDLNSKSP